MRALTALAVPLLALSASAEPAAVRPAQKGCAWVTAESKGLGLSVRHQKCDWGFRTVDFAFVKGKDSLFQVMRDAEAKKDDLYPVITVFSKKADERIEDAVKRVASKGLSLKKRRHCRVTYRRMEKAVADRLVLAYAPDEGYAAELAKEAGTDIPEPGCGEMGEMPDSLVYWEYHPKESKTRFAFVSAGQDDPLFDEESLRFEP